MDRKLLVATFCEYAPVEELADLLKFTSCEDCLYYFGVVRGIKGEDREIYYCKLGLDESAGGCNQGVKMDIMRD